MYTEKRGSYTIPTELEESTCMENQNKIHKPRTLSCQYQHFRDLFFLRSRCLICMQYLFLPQTQVNQTPPPPFFASCGTQIYREIINIRTIMMKTIKKRLNLYTKNILIGWGSCLFLEFTFVFFTSNIQSP